MKKYEMLGKVLSKKEQKKIKGGTEDPAPCTKGACTEDSQCGHVECICGTTTIDPNPKCYSQS